MTRYVTIMLRVSWEEKRMYERAAAREHGQSAGNVSRWMRDTLLERCAPPVKTVKEVFPDARVKRVRRTPKK